MEQTSRKYVLTDDVIYSSLKLSVKVKLHRIKAVRPFRLANGATVLKDEIGGFIESEANLDQEGGCWLGCNACAWGDALVCGDAIVSDFGMVYGDAIVQDQTIVMGGAQVCGHAKVKGLAVVGVGEVIDGFEVVGENKRGK